MKWVRFGPFVAHLEPSASAFYLPTCLIFRAHRKKRLQTATGTPHWDSASLSWKTWVEEDGAQAGTTIGEAEQPCLARSGRDSGVDEGGSANGEHLNKKVTGIFVGGGPTFLHHTKGHCGVQR